MSKQTSRVKEVRFHMKQWLNSTQIAKEMSKIKPISSARVRQIRLENNLKYPKIKPFKS